MTNRTIWTYASEGAQNAMEGDIPMRISKTAQYLRGAGTLSLLTGIPLLAAPEVALADGWTQGVLDTSAQQVGQDSAGKPTAEGISETVRKVSGWILGIAIVLFVLKVVLTAVDRILVGNDSQSGYPSNSFLTRIPIVGAYPLPTGGQGGERGYTWKDIWVHFGVQIAIAISAWFLVQLSIGIVSAVVSRV